MSQYQRASISLLSSELKLRTSTDPVVMVPTSGFKHPNFKKGDFIYWLPLTEHLGVQLLMSGAYSDFRKAHELPHEVARYFNRLYFIQLLNTPSVRHVICHDEYIDEDIAWAGLVKDSINPKKYRLPKRK